MSYKTLIIVDNTNELTSLNREIIKETLKAFIKNNDKENKVAIAVTGETAEYLTDYEDSINTQLKTVDALEFKEINAPGADVLMEVLINWKESDVAYRDILYISCRGVDIGSEYSEEELLFEVNGKQYPIYTLACSQNENTSFIKGINSLSRISGGVCVSTDDALKDAEVEKQLSEKILKAMKEYREIEQANNNKDNLDSNSNLKEENEGENVSENALAEDYGDAVLSDDASDVKEYYTEEYETGIYTSDSDITTEEIGSVIYENRDDVLPVLNGMNILLPVVCLVAGIVIVTFVILIRRKDNTTEQKGRSGKGQEKKTKNTRTKSENPSVKSCREPFEFDDTTETVCLSNTVMDEDSGTRLLYQTKEGLEITLEDRGDPTKYFRACIRDSIVIGRNEKVCDLPITYDDSISLRHCELYQRDSCIYCRDLGSSNGTMINQQKVYQEIKVESGDILRIGRLSFFVQIVGDNYG